MSKTFDVIVAGIGGMGSAACYQLAKRGVRVLGLEKFEIGHAMGSSHGLTRILRLAYFEGEAYVPLVQRARELWIETGKLTGEPLFFEVGALDIAHEGSGIVEKALEASQAHGLEHELLDRDAIEARYPFTLDRNHVGLYQPQSGFVASERAILAHTALALHHGAEIHGCEAMLGWEPTAGGGVRVTTDQGSYEAGRLILSPGAWIGELVPTLKPSTEVVLQTLGWFAPARPSLFDLSHFPVFTLEADEGHFYGFPLWQHPGFKLGSPHYGGEAYDPDTPSREPSPRHREQLRACLAKHIPGANGDLLGLKACMYTMTPDEHFVLDLHPAHPNVAFAAGFSGHGFKFASVIGEILADLATEGATRHPIGFLRLDRFAR